LFGDVTATVIYTSGIACCRDDLFFENHLVIIAIKLFLPYQHGRN